MTSKQFTLLIVDDTPKNIQVLGKILSEEGYLISAASNGKKALQIADQIRPNLILLDIMMPEMDGYQVLESLKQSANTREIPVILLTAKAEREDIVKGFQAGASDYITKPFKQEELLARIRTHIMLQESLNDKIQNEKLKAVLETAGAACHELNQPLQSLFFNSELLKMTFPEESDLHEKINGIMTQVERIATITRKLMGITTYETKEYIKGKKIIDINKASGKQDGQSEA